MNKKIILGLSVLSGIFVLSSSVLADTIYLKNGRKIRGQIVEKDEKQMKVDIGGVKITYFSDEIDHIDSEGAPPSSPTAGGSGSGDKTPALATPPIPNPSGALPVIENAPPANAAPVITPTPSNAAPVTIPMPSPNTVDKAPDAALANKSNVADSKKDLIQELINVSGTKETMTQMFDQIISQAPVDQAPVLKSVLNINEIINRLIPIYDKYFNEGELKELIAFYKGQTGRKLIKVMPLLMEDSMNASMAYFQEKMPAPNNTAGANSGKDDQK